MLNSSVRLTFAAPFRRPYRRPILVQPPLHGFPHCPRVLSTVATAPTSVANIACVKLLVALCRSPSGARLTDRRKEAIAFCCCTSGARSVGHRDCPPPTFTELESALGAGGGRWLSPLLRTPGVGGRPPRSPI